MESQLILTATHPQLEHGGASTLADACCLQELKQQLESALRSLADVQVSQSAGRQGLLGGS
jgi:hypothetical protein